MRGSTSGRPRHDAGLDRDIHPRLDHCQRRAAGEPADEAGEDQLIAFAANYGQSLDWIVLGDLDPTIRRLYAIGHDDDDLAVMVA